MWTIAAIAVIWMTAIISGGVVRIRSKIFLNQLGSRCRWTSSHDSIDRDCNSVETYHSDASSQPFFVRRIPRGITASESIAGMYAPDSFSNNAGGEQPPSPSKLNPTRLSRRKHETAARSGEISRSMEEAFMPMRHTQPACRGISGHVFPVNRDVGGDRVDHSPRHVAQRRCRFATHDVANQYPMPRRNIHVSPMLRLSAGLRR